ncbi:MAG: PaaI family thioesterase [Acidobacteria bacterium]|nr:PaaI family thioesterase [Acidobacteriota bacterium]
MSGIDGRGRETGSHREDPAPTPGGSGGDGARRCFACGPDNPIGLHIHFRLDGEVCRGEFTPGENHGGFDGVTHGGILYSALDDVMANWLYLRGARGYTARCEVRYREALPIGTKISLESRMLKKKGRFVILEGKAVRAADGAVIAESQGFFNVFDAGTAAIGS